MADQQWKKNLGFLESIMFDPVTSGILGLGEGIMSLFGVSEKNSQIDDLKNDYEKMKFTEDQMARRQSDVKRLYGNQLDSMNGAAGLLNGNVYKSIQVAKQASETAKGILDQRMKDEQVNLGITDKINQLEGQKSGYVPAVANTIAQTAQGIFGAVQASMGMDQKEQQNDLLRSLMGNEPSGTATGVTSPITGREVYIPDKADTSLVNQDAKTLPKRNVWDILGISDNIQSPNAKIGTQSEIDEALLNFGKISQTKFQYPEMNSLNQKFFIPNQQTFNEEDSMLMNLLPNFSNLISKKKKTSLYGGLR